MELASTASRIVSAPDTGAPSVAALRLGAFYISGFVKGGESLSGTFLCRGL